MNWNYIESWIDNKSENGIEMPMVEMAMKVLITTKVELKCNDNVSCWIEVNMKVELKRN